MKRVLALLAAISMLLLVVSVSPALAGHKDGHGKPPSCDDHPRKPRPQNKHCYPPGSAQQSSSGNPASFATDIPQQGTGITVGMATIVAIAALGGLLIARRRWVFRTHSS